MNKGAAAILLIILISSVLLLIVLATSVIIIAELKASRNIGDSIVAFYAADAGAERCLYELQPAVGGLACGNTDKKPYQDFLSNGAKYIIDYEKAGSFTSIGEAPTSLIRRKVELTF